MSPRKKKAAKSTTKKSGAKAKSAKSKKKAAPKKKARPAKTASKKTKAKKSAKAASRARVKTTTKKAAAKTTAKKAAKTPAKQAAPKKAAAIPKAKTPSKKKANTSPAQTETTKVKPKAPKDRTRGKETRSSKRARARKPVTPSGPRHPKLGFRWTCFGCGVKFYDLGKEEPICPRCETNQHQRPPENTRPTVATPKPKVVRPMAQLLDDEEPAVNPEEDRQSSNASPAQNEMFDDTGGEAAGLDIDDADLADAAHEPPEIDAL